MRSRYGQRWGETLQKNGYRMTVPREAIINLLSGSEKHLSAEDIYMAIHPENQAIGLTTIYRTLELLQRMGILQKFEFGHGRAKYELSEDYGNKKHHHHLICSKCEKIIDYTEFAKEELEFIGKVEKGLEQNYGFTIDSHILHFYGICDQCKGK
jgi:Fur family ferric uptake transcriptional regulator